MDGSDAQLTEALAQAAVAAGEVPMQQPTPLQSKGAEAPPLRLVDTAAPTEGVTVEGDEPVSFEEAFIAEKLGTEVEPDEGELAAEADVERPLTKEEELAQREAELDRRETEMALQQQVAENNAWWEDKLQEGLDWKAQQLADIEAYGAQTGKSDYEIERAKAVFRDQAYEPWLNNYWSAREQGIVEPYLNAQGTDAISTLIKEHGLTAADRPTLLKHISNPEMMKVVAEVMGTERARVAERDTKVVRQAARNVAARNTAQQIAPQGPGSGTRPPTTVRGSDAELDFMVRNRPTLHRQTA
jgi:hypothetical protein